MSVSDDWDYDRIDQETEKLKEQGEEEHPIWAYMRGETRWDLGAPFQCLGASVTPRDYLGPGFTPFELSRLGVDMFHQARDLADACGVNKMAEFCCKYGVVDAPGWDFTRTRDGCLTARCMQQLHDCGAPELVRELGLAVFNLSKPLTNAEKKH